ncbi:S8/S53 family peptidase [Lysinibacillus sp. SGAir0095]|uniref:S8 family peptidase n=1 Tax=Lysinibacillus sp. SGAir0095 TaxID=2070463 RepID=UPI0010CD0281|nr:S8/S53 family peptidase [Lysinibacillus sp. SGAir0095]QCR33560.1 hypothetical protein C1N55_15990 [Lysinibacillus sp. SGAir0095]
MKYIIRLIEPFNNSIKLQLEKLNISIRLIDNVLEDLLIVETENSQILHNLGFIRSVKPTRKGKLLISSTKTTNQDFKIDIVPSFKEELIHDTGLVGFGTNIVILDSGYNGNCNINLGGQKVFTDDGIIYDYINHGTLVAGIISKIAPAAKLYLGKICSKDPYDIDEELVFQGLNWATEIPNINIINLSIGIDFKCTGNCDLAERVNKMSSMGYTIISAAGNKNHIHCPACSQEGIAVGALDASGKVVAQSSASGLGGTDKPDLVAQGQIVENYLRKSQNHTGTSFASPIITGLVGATFHHIKEGISPKYHLLSSTSSLLNQSFNKQGYGIVDLNKYLGGLDYVTSKS